MQILKNKYMKKSDATKLINFRCTETEFQIMKSNADRFAGGNLSAWIRYACIELKAQKRHMEK